MTRLYLSGFKNDRYLSYLHDFINYNEKSLFKDAVPREIIQYNIDDVFSTKNSFFILCGIFASNFILKDDDKKYLAQNIEHLVKIINFYREVQKEMRTINENKVRVVSLLSEKLGIKKDKINSLSDFITQLEEVRDTPSQ